MAIERAGPEAILSGLNPAQREAVTTVRGPVAILAGAGTGKTTTVTRRIAYQVASGCFRADRILAVTFTDRAAGELRSRLAALGVAGVEARTFHSAALSQLSRLWSLHTGTELPQVLDAKAPIIATLANGLPPPHRFVPRRELASEIEWAKVRTITADGYLDGLELEGHDPPIPAELMARVYQGYERRKRAMGRLDFEDMLGLAVRLFGDHPTAAEEVRERIHAITVDEFQDVNPLQVQLLDLWLGGRDELCVVGDDHQTIYTFAGASPQHLLGFADWFPNARLVKLEENHRSTQQVLEVANRLAPRLGGFTKILRATRPPGPVPVVRPVRDIQAEVDLVVAQIRRLNRDDGVPFEEMAIVYRINARSEEFEEALAAEGIPFQVKDGAFLFRPGAREVLRRLRTARGTPPPDPGPETVGETVARTVRGLGLDPDGEPGSAEEATRQADLSRIRSLAFEFDVARPGEGVEDFVAELRRRFSQEGVGRGVNLLTYHRAKGLEFEAVFLPRLVDRELPFRSGRRAGDEAEERRLLYVGITRARRYLCLTWPMDARAGRSPFVDELLPDDARARGGTAPSLGARPGARQPAAADVSAADIPALDALKRWRLARARDDGVPAYVVFHDRTLSEIAERRPASLAALASIRGVGPAKLERYGPDVLGVVSDIAG